MILKKNGFFWNWQRNLIGLTSVQDRRRIASLLASHAEMPDDLLESLAADEDDLTAYSALRYSPRLSVDLLLQTARTGPDTLRKAVANRPSLRESVLTALCEHAGANVIQLLLDRKDVILNGNQQAKMSRRPDIVATLGLELAGQDALNPDGLMGQFLHLPTQLKSKAIAAAEMTSLVKQAQSPGGGTDRPRTTDRLRVCDALLLDAINQNKANFSDRLSQGLGLPIATCDLLLQSDQAEGLTIALKALGMGPTDTTTVLIRLFGETLTLENLRSLLRLHRTVSAGAAEVLVGQWLLSDASEPAKSARHEIQYQGREQQDGHQPLSSKPQRPDAKSREAS